MEIDPRLPKIMLERADGMLYRIVNMFDGAGRKTIDVRKAMVGVALCEEESDPDKRMVLVRFVPEYSPYAEGTMH